MNQLNLKIIIGAVVVLIVGAAGGYWIAQRGTESADAGVAAHGERRVLYWHDPMVPNARFDKPGKSPFMDMQLVPVYADEHGGAAVSVSSVVTQNLGMRLGIVEKAVLQPKLAAVGSVAFGGQCWI